MEAVETPPAQEKVEAKRAQAIAAFNQFFLDKYQRSLEGGEYLSSFNKLESGVRLATGVEVVDPEGAIPIWYKGDGSFQTTFHLQAGGEVTQTEHIPWIFPDDSEGKPYFSVLMLHSRLFKEEHSLNYADRVRLEAYYDSLEAQRSGRWSPDTSYFEFSEWDLRERREIVFPV